MISPAPHREGPLRALKSVLEIIVVAIFLTTFVLQPFRIPTGSMVPTLRVGDFILVDKQTFGPGAGRYGILPKSSVKRGDLIVFHWPVDPTRHLVKRVIAIPGDRIRLRRGHVILNGQPLTEPYTLYTPSRPNSFRDEFPSLREADPIVEPLWWITLRHSLDPTTERGAPGLASETWDPAKGAGVPEPALSSSKDVASEIWDRSTPQPAELTVPAGDYFVLGDNRNDSEDSRYWGFVPRSAIVGRPLLVYFTIPPESTEPLLTRLRNGLGSARILR